MWYERTAMNKKMIFVFSAVIAAAVLTALLFFLNTRGGKIINATEFTAEEYVKAYIDDDIGKQYGVLDVSVFSDSGAVDEITAQYKNKPLMSTNYSYYIKKVKTADENTLKKINNVYIKRFGNENVPEIKNAERFSIRLRNKSTSKDVFKVNLWLVKINDEWKICTVYEYDRSIDRCFAADMY